MASLIKTAKVKFNQMENNKTAVLKNYKMPLVDLKQTINIKIVMVLVNKLGINI
jgi:hypothetical protein